MQTEAADVNSTTFSPSAANSSSTNPGTMSGSATPSTVVGEASSSGAASTSKGAGTGSSSNTAGGGPSTNPGVRTGATVGRENHGIVPDIQNVVATTNLDVSLNLKEIAVRARNAEYNPKRFAAVIMRIREPKTTALIFSSGKIVVTGAKSENESSRASRKYAKIIHKLGYDKAKFKEFTVQNIVASCDVNFPVCLEALAFAHHQFCSYEPELFPGLIYRMYNPKIVLLIFVSGKVVLTGAKDKNDIYNAFDNIYHVLTKFKKSNKN